MIEYRIRCRDCGMEWDALQRMADAAPPCPKCDGVDTHRVLQAVPAHFHATGFYATEY
jgi:putative FmdB family regulatory protein